MPKQTLTDDLLAIEAVVRQQPAGASRPVQAKPNLLSDSCTTHPSDGAWQGRGVAGAGGHLRAGDFKPAAHRSVLEFEPPRRKHLFFIGYAAAHRVGPSRGRQGRPRSDDDPEP